MTASMLPGLLVDVDGVLTDQDARADVGAIGLLTELVGTGVPAALVTGRSRGWLERQILPHLRDRASRDGGAPGSLWCAAEYGAVLAAGLSASWRISDEFTVPPDLREALRRLTLATDAEPFLEWDESKECMATVEARHGDSGDDTHRERTQAALDRYLEGAVRLAAPRGLNVLRATYAVDVTAPGLTKRVGAAWALEQFSAGGPGPSEVLVFGDSAGDVEMVRVARERGAARVGFVWLGRGPAPAAPGAHVVSPGARFGAGAREAFAELLARVRR